jgi:hypothetical protein
MTGRLDAAREKFGQVTAISQPAGDGATASMALVFAAELESWEGKYDQAARLYDEGLALAEKVGDENYTPRYLNSLGRPGASQGTPHHRHGDVPRDGHGGFWLAQAEAELRGLP